MNTIQNAAEAGDAKPTGGYTPAVDYEPDDVSPSPADAAYVPFPVPLLPTVAGRFVTEASEAMYVDPAYVALPALVAMAAAGGDAVRVTIKKFWHEPAILWGMLSARSATNKTAPARLAFAPLRKVNGQLIREYEAELEAHAKAIAVYERDLADWKKRGRKKQAVVLGDGDDLLGTDDEPPTPPAPPPVRRVLIDDVTIERLFPILRDNPRGLTIFRDDLAGWIGSFDRYASSGGGDLPKWLSMHTGENVDVDRGGTSGRGVVVHVPRAAVSVYGTIQPGVLRKSMTGDRTAAGLFARLLIVSPPWRAKRSTEAELSEATAEAWAGLLGTLGNREMGVDEDGEPVPHFMGLSRDARRAFDRWADTHNASAEGEPDNVTAAIGKLEAYAVRFALLFALCDEADVVGIGHIQRGSALATWFANEARRVYAMAEENGAAAGQRELGEWAARRGPAGATASDLATSGPRRFRGRPGEADAALSELARSGFGTYAFPPGGESGRPSKRFVARPATGGGGI